MKSMISVFIIFLTLQVSAQSYRLVKVRDLTQLSITMIQQAGIDLENARLAKDGTMDIPVSPTGFTKLLSLPVQFQVIIPDLNSYYKSRPALSESEKQSTLRQSKESFGVEGFGYGSMGGYYTYAEIVANMDSMYAHYPNLITQKFSLGNSTEGRPVWAAKISDNPNQNEQEPHVFYDALIHAREPQSMAVVMYYMWYLLENYGTNPEVTYLVNNREIYFVPCFNPDGYEYNHSTDPQGGGMWRLNRRNNGNGTYGVDLNRNFGYKWGYDNTGSSPTPGDETYRGPSAFSEPEPQHIRDFLNGKNVKTYINYHSYNNSVIYPWGYANAFTPDSATFVEYASYMVQFNGFDYGNSYQTLGYVSNGTARDWGYGEQSTKGKAYSYTFEVGGDADGFWPAQSRILPLAQANIRPNLFQAWIAGGYPMFESVTYDRQYFLPNDTAAVSIKLRNRGLSSAYNVKVTATSLSLGLSVVNSGMVTMDSLQARTSATIAQPIRFAVGADVLANAKLKMLLTTSVENSVISYDTVSVVVGLPTYLLIDSANTIGNLWTVTASPTTPAWETTTASFVSPATSYTDSKTGVYANNATVTMSLNHAINLTGYPSAKLTFSAKWDIEKKWDCMVLQISTDNGTTWNAVAGNYTVPASGSGKQTPAGMPCYDGAVTSWVNESIDLGPYANKQIKLRFELRTDNSQQKDGVYLDDIGIIVYTLQQQPTTTWSNAITIKDAGNVTQNVTFGLAPSATDGIDVSLGEVTLPPLPPSGVFDTRFELPVTPVEYSAKDFRKDTVTSVDWLLKFQPGLAGYPVTLTWNPAALPQGTFTLKDVVTGTLVNVDMKAQNECIVTNAGITSLKIVFRKQVCKDISLAAGWNMVSVPLTAINMTSTGVFTQATSQVYGFNNGYNTVSTLENGKGYWVRYGAQSIVSVCGSPNTAAVPVSAGWNMIGMYDADVQVAAIASNPPNIVNSVFYGFNNGYNQASVLTAGKGYWVRASQNGTLTVSGSAKPGSEIAAQAQSLYPYLEFTDASGNKGLLYFAPTGSAVDIYSLPPVPPQGVFDIRFANGNAVTTEVRALAQLTNAQYPLTIQAHGGRIIVRDALTHGKQLDVAVDENRSFTLTQAMPAIEAGKAEIPTAFALEQNYPNPFNPATVIRYQLPANSKVTLKVFDCLGTETAVLVDEQQSAGYHTVSFNAVHLASGVYYYTLSAGNTMLSRKMLLLK